MPISRVLLNFNMQSARRYFASSSMSNLSNFTKTSRKIVCVGRNYAEHVKELNNEMPSLEEPIIFLKPPSSFLLNNAGRIRIPKNCEVHHEVELGLIVGTGGSDIPQEKAIDHIGGYCLALDLTARNVQDKAKKKGHPWTVAKGYDTFTPVSEFIPKTAIKDLNDVRLWCKVDEDMRQDGNTRDMMYKLPFLISYISGIMTLEPGDVILTGTPKGVGPISAGQVITCGISNGTEKDFSSISFQIEQR